MEELFTYVLRLADNNWFLSYRLGEYVSKGPYLEEDLALTNTGVDLIGQAEILYKYASEIMEGGVSPDELAYRRSEHEYYNAQLVEAPNSDYAYIQARQIYMDLYNFYLLEKLKESKDELLSSYAKKSIKEVTYHLKRSTDWILRFGLGTEESKLKIQAALDELWKYTGELFEVDELQKTMQEKGIAPDLSQIKEKWFTRLTEILNSAELQVPAGDYFMTGGRKGYHTEHMGYMLTEIQYLNRLYPDAVW
ncbi:MAG: phenylacetate-CoA oxygenase subunit PaaC [Flavobacteriales bacterium]|nr:phenylacetate-CoA oxygenase subunit PaaC [Flavobacteriales bacterium]